MLTNQYISTAACKLSECSGHLPRMHHVSEAPVHQAAEVLARSAFTEALVPDRATTAPIAMTSQFHTSLCFDSFPCTSTCRSAATSLPREQRLSQASTRVRF